MQGYFDYNASSLLRPEAAAAMLAWIEDGGGNPSSMHARGRRARLALEEARRRVATLAEGAVARDVVFTSGATESNNTVLRGFAAVEPNSTIVTSVVEHHSVLATLDDLEARGHRVVRLAVRPDSSLDLDPLREAASRGTCLVSLGLANGETGAVLDLDAVLAAAGDSTFVHLDVAQAAGRLAIPFGRGVDALSLSGHKFGSPPGIGATFFSARMRGLLRPLLTGGPQEWSQRAGTPNVPGILAMGAAAEAAMAARESENARLAALRDRLWSSISAATDDVVRITPADGLANTLTIALAGASADSLIAALDRAGCSISAGAAGAAGSPEPSHVMKALGLDSRWHGGVLRLSAGWASTDVDTAALAAALTTSVGRARSVA
jgi:cysteine desulfurase